MAQPAAESYRPHTHIPPQAIPASISKGVDEFAAKSRTLANQILRDAAHEKVEVQGPVVIHHYYTPWSYYFYPSFWYPQPVVYVDRSRDNRDEATRVLVGVAFAIIGAIATIAVGAAYCRLRDARQELKGTDELQRNLNVYSDMNVAPNVNYVKNVNKLIELKTRICTRVKNSALADLILRIGTFVASALAVGAALTLLPGYFMPIGVVAATVFGIGMLFKLAMESKRSDIEDARAIHQTIAALTT